MSQRTSPLIRRLDRYVGIPLVAAFSVVPKRKRPRDGDIRRIGILKSAAIGDVLLLAGIPTALKRRFPGAVIVMISGSDNAGAARLLPDVDEHVRIDPRRPLAAARLIRRLSIDVLLECGPWPRLDALLAIVSGAQYRVGFRVRGQRRHYGFDRVVEHSAARHQLENFRDLARAIGVEAFDSPSLRQAARDGGRSSAPYAVFHPWSGGNRGSWKEWPNDRWIELGGELSASRHWRILVSGGRQDTGRSEELAAGLRAVGCAADSIAGQYPLDELSGVLIDSRVVVSVNTGIMHLAALCGAATVSLEGPVPVERWGPIGPRVRSVVTTLSGCGYLDLGFEYDGQRPDCMLGVSVAAVLDAIRDLTA